jgi:hypothetical protein
MCLFLHFAESVEDLLFTIAIDNDLLSSVSVLVQPVREGRLDSRMLLPVH